ncbi:MAG: TonB-dependent receptor [Flavobacteriaceae bacterium]
MRFGFISVFVLFVFSGLFAQETPQDSVTVLEEVILYTPAQKKVTLGITPSSIIREKAFQNFSPVDIQGSINQISGVYVLSGALNTNRITIRGVGARTPFGTDKLRLYYNDIPVTNGAGFSTLEAYDLENLSAIEVVKGPKGTAYGANLGGAISLRSKSPENEPTGLFNTFTVGSYNTIKDNLSFVHREQGFRLGLHYNFLQTDGYRENNSFDRDGLLLDTSFKTGSKSSINFLLNYIDYTAQIPSSLSQTAFDEDPTQAAFTWAQARGFETNKYTLAGLSYKTEVLENLKNTTSVFYTYLDHYEPRPFNILDEFTSGYGLRSIFNGDFRLADNKASYLVGAEFYRDEYNWSTYENLYEENNGNGSLQGDQLSENREFRRQFFIFTSVGMPITEKFKAQLGLNINKTNYDYRDLFNSGEDNKSASRSFNVIWLPNLDLEYRFNNNALVYGNISRGFSNPNLEETLTPDGLINPEIEQEKGFNYEIGTKWSLLKARLWFNLALFRMNINDLLVADRVGEDQFVGRNAGKTKHQGIELDMNYSWILGGDFKLSPFISYTLSDHSFVDFVDGDDDFSGNELTGVPRHRVNAGVRLEKNRVFYWNTTYQYVGEIPLTDANSLYSEAFGILNTRMGFTREFSARFSLGIDLGVNNIFDVVYARSVLINAVGFGGSEPRYFYPGPNRNYYGGLRLRYVF